MASFLSGSSAQRPWPLGGRVSLQKRVGALVDLVDERHGLAVEQWPGPSAALEPAAAVRNFLRAGCQGERVCSSTTKPAGERPWTERLWLYDLRTNQHFTLKQNPLRRQHLDDFVQCYASDKPRSERVERNGSTHSGWCSAFPTAAGNHHCAAR